MIKKLLLTGGAGFVGHQFVEGVLKNTDWEIVVLDRLDISGSMNRLLDIDIWEKENHRIKFICWDLKAEFNDYVKGEIGKVDYVWHLAASSHVARSIENPLNFVMDNVVGTCNVLNFARGLPDLERFLYFSTDEVFGPAPAGYNYREWDRYKSGNPYAATKAGGEELALAFYNTYKLPVFITHSMNVMGERQHPEKFIPLIIRKTLLNEKITIHNGSRFWIHARNACGAVLFLNKEAKVGEKYNIVGEKELQNRELAELIGEAMGKKVKYDVVDASTSRPGHDQRYSLDGTRLSSMGFVYPKTFYQSVDKMVKWMIDKKHRKWLNL